jgi:hypothetical protein
MKKVFTFSLLLLFSISLLAQDTKAKSDMKNFRFGVTALPSVCGYKPDDLKKFKKGGSVLGFGVLVNAEYSFSGNFAIGFGLGLGSGGGKIDFLDTIQYFVNDGAILALKDGKPNLVGVAGKTDTFLLKTRTYKASYYNIPISLKMRTNEIGHIRYFIEPRLNIGIRKKVRADDDVINLGVGSTNLVQNPDLNITKDMSALRMSVTISGGAEYALTGSTAIVFALGYDYGLSNIVQNTSGNLLRTKDKVRKQMDQKFNQNGIVLSVGVLF